MSSSSYRSVNGRTIGRFAPSPTGPLHIGSLVAVVASYAMAKREGGLWLLRMEDLDAPRVVPGMADDILRTLEALGFEWDGGIVWQSSRIQAYEAAMERLVTMGHVYSCGCSRAEIARAATAPHDGDGELPYPNICRNGLPEGKSPRSYRLRVGEGPVAFHDLIMGPKVYDLSRLCGDFVIKRADGPFAYQLAVVVDDAYQGVNQVVRGVDLLSSTPRQILLQRLLGYETPSYAHVPLVTAPGGGKLSKRDNGVSLVAGLDPSREGGNLILAALRFLGQRTPDCLAGAPGREILSWAAAHFDPSLVPSGSGPLVLSSPSLASLP